MNIKHWEIKAPLGRLEFSLQTGHLEYHPCSKQIGMNSAFRLWLLGTTFASLSHLKFSISTRPPPCRVEPVPATNGDTALHRSSPGFHEFSARSLGQDGRAEGTTSGLLEIDLNEPACEDFRSEYHPGGREGLLRDSGDGPQDDAVRPISPVRVKLEKGVEPSESKFPLAHDVQNVGLVRSVMLSNKREKEHQTKDSDIFRQKKLKRENQEDGEKPEAVPAISMKQEPIIHAVEHSPGDFKIIELDDTWDPLFKWAATYLGDTNQSPVAKAFLLEFGDQLTQINNKLPPRMFRKKISLKSVPIELIQAHGLQSERLDPGNCSFLILPTGFRGKDTKFSRTMCYAKYKAVQILELLVLFHGLSISCGLSHTILGQQIGNKLEDLVGWYKNIFLKDTEDGLPLFGWFEGTSTEAKQSEDRFFGIKKEMAIVLSAWHWSRKSLHHKAELALSLLAYWYAKQAHLKIPGLGSANQAEAYWKLVSEIREACKAYFKWGSSIIHEPEDKILSIIQGQETVTKSLVIAIEHLLKQQHAGIPDTSRAYIAKQVKSYVERSRFDLDHGGMLSLDSLPLYLVPVARSQDGSGHQEAFVGLRGIEARHYPKQPKLKLLTNRITEIAKSLGILHGIASCLLGDIVLGNCDGLIQWYLSILFDQTAESLPIFGWVNVPFPYVQSPESAFGPVHKYLSTKLNHLGMQSTNQAHRIAITLFGMWYAEIAAKAPHPESSQLPSYQILLDQMAGYLKLWKSNHHYFL
ncbi:hypothetical protein PTTG_25174 [Puccinia triticina 1-1 BBBD Race 1]|uniref:Uncharacterized protein n=1 Tax=Puccinia triticina (isolate 1-1 / race 1 (BBBD)) TaxID=630390 RepID=A0A180H6T9_PUCT1|nr:hypothetical protein PTTG_25174 [Puccinia triticina 1-1 BBBD Race 1]